MAADGVVDFLHAGTPRTFGDNTVPTPLLGGNVMADASQQYLLSLAVLAAIVAGVGLLLAFLACGLSCCACCRCGCFKVCLGCREGEVRSWMLILLIVSSLAFVGLGYGAVVPAQTIGDTFTSTIAAINKLGKHMTDSADSLGMVSVKAASVRNTTAVALEEVRDEAARPGTPSYNQSITRLETITAAVTACGVTLNRSSAAITLVSAPLASFNVLAARSEYRDYTRFGPLGATIGFASVVLLLLVTVLPCCGCYRYVHRAASCLVIVFLFLLWTTAGVVLAGGVVVADVCADPSGNAIRAAGVYERTTPPTLEPSVAFYTQCDPAFLNDPEGVNMTNTPVQLVRDAHALLVAAQPSAEALRASLPRPSEYPQASDAQSLGEAALAAYGDLFRRTLALLTDNLECAEVRPLWLAIPSAACTGFLNEGLVLFWGLQVGAAVMLFVVLLFNLVVCVQHPGYAPEEEFEGPSSKPTVSPVANSTGMHYGTVRRADDGGREEDRELAGYEGGYGH